MRPRVDVPSRTAVTAIVPPVGISLDYSDLSIRGASSTFSLVAAIVVGVKLKVMLPEVEAKLLCTRGYSDGRSKNRQKNCFSH